MKLCKDCKWYRKDWIENIIFRSNKFDMCASPNTTDDPVTGSKHRFCDMLRAHRWQELDWSCGPDGKYWEAK
jgi:hypothetical protein